ncbi:hypothetical protein RND81_05G112000 [Saponaria officinalis]|uniref:Uncharacterized protein n=1 Tax=Saponaria officinalis TaxID=3572 RepID=A0AAW1KWW8_SAPOF
MSRIWTATTSIFRRPEIRIQNFYSSFSTVLRWPSDSFSSFTTGWSTESLRWLNFWVVDNVLWSVVTFVESLALFALLCFFFTFCGCTV